MDKYGVLTLLNRIFAKGTSGARFSSPEMRLFFLAENKLT